MGGLFPYCQQKQLSILFLFLLALTVPDTPSTWYTWEGFLAGNLGNAPVNKAGGELWRKDQKAPGDQIKLSLVVCYRTLAFFVRQEDIAGFCPEEWCDLAYVLEPLIIHKCLWSRTLFLTLFQTLRKIQKEQGFAMRLFTLLLGK